MVTTLWIPQPHIIEVIYICIYSHPQIDGKVNHHQISRDLLFHLFGDDYIYTCYIVESLQ